ncbi:MAG: methyl-accepting chemotaxis protein, partial [Planctomycetota bacterium]
MFGIGGVRGKLIATLGVFIVLLLASLAIAAMRVNTMSNALAVINEVNSAKQRQAINFRGSVHDRAILIRDLVLYEDPASIETAIVEIEALEAAYDAARSELDLLVTQYPAADVDEAYSAINGIEAATRPLVDTIVRERRAGRMNQDVEQALNESRRMFTDWLAAINVLIDKQEAKNLELGGTVSRIASTFTMVVVGPGGAALVIGGIAAFLLVRLISRRIKAIEDGMTAVTRDDHVTDLTIRLDESTGDEFGRIASACNRVLVKLTDTVKSVADASSAVTAESAEASDQAEAIAHTTQRQLDQTGQVAAAIEQMSASIGNIASNGSSAAEAARRSEQRAVEGGNVVREVIQKMQAIAEHVEDCSREVTELSVKGESIGEIIAVINDIADQTNLLALNAAIEAARAGEHGRGFAVVADEVRKLAERTTTATEEVSRSIRDIQSGTHSAGQR